MQDNRLVWFDLDLSNKPYKIMRYHNKPLEAVAFHRTYPLFASASDDATVHVFHGMVYQVTSATSLLSTLHVDPEHLPGSMKTTRLRQRSCAMTKMQC